MSLDDRIYDAIRRDETGFLLQVADQALLEPSKPPGWTHRAAPGRPRKRGRGRPETFAWEAMAKVLLFQNALDLDYRRMEGYLRSAPELCHRMGLSRAPSRNTIWRALRRFPEPWLHEFNDAVLTAFKKKRADLAAQLSARTRQG
jgi:hypothetical protein